MNALYYESHVTYEPLDEFNVERFCKMYGFRTVKLTGKNRNEFIATTRHTSFDLVRARTYDFVNDLARDSAATITRFKIEAAVVDSKIEAYGVE